MLTRTIGHVYTNPSSGWHKVMFADGGEVMAPPDHEFTLPLEVGQEGIAGTKPQTTNGRAWDMLTEWREHTASDVSVAAQAPLPPEAAKPKAANKAPVRPAVRFDNRELSIMAQVALKEACETARAQGAMSKDGFEKTGVTVTRAKALFNGMLKMIAEAQP